MKHILVGTDGSEGARRAVAAAAELAKSIAGDLHILHIQGDPDLVREIEKAAPAGVADALDAHAQRILRDARQYALAAGLHDVTTEARWGDAAEAMLELIQSRQFDAVVVGRRGRGRLSGLLLGSLSQKLASLAPCVVIIVP